MRTAQDARIWLRSNEHLPDHATTTTTIGFMRAWAKRVVALDEIDRICAHNIDRIRDDSDGGES